IAHIALKVGATDALPSASLLARIDFFSLAVALIAAVALIRYKMGVIPVLLACALSGLAWRLLA
ncbi:MAG: chromate transporter, partial [Burkholderiaceae bacterium]|nr:chromate transporter [Burkholderiaceae bacterium]